MGVKVRQKDGKWYVFIHHQGKRKAKCVGDSKRAAPEVKRKLDRTAGCSPSGNPVSRLR